MKPSNNKLVVGFFSHLAEVVDNFFTGKIIPGG